MSENSDDKNQFPLWRGKNSNHLAVGEDLPELWLE